LIIAGGHIEVAAANDGLRGKDSISVKDGVLTITADGDGLQSDNQEDSSKGWIAIDGGNLTITAGNDGIQAQTVSQVRDGSLSITTGGSDDAVSAKGIKAGADVIILGGSVTIDIRMMRSMPSPGSVNSGKNSISSGDDGIQSDTGLTINDGHAHHSQCYEGLESAAITLSGERSSHYY
jgi:hypothetical protein